MDVNEKKFRNRFCDSFPIQVVHSPYFEERLEILNTPLRTLDKWNEFNKVLYQNFNGDYAAFLEHYNTLKRNVIEDVSSSDFYKTFNSCDMNMFASPKVESRSSIFTSLNDGEKFISIDLKKANFQALKYFDSSIVFGCDSYDEFISRYTDINYFKESKYLRERIFGELNPKRTTTIEKYILSRIIREVLSKIEWLNGNFEIYTVNSDEVIYKLSNKDNTIWETIDDNLLATLKGEIYNYNVNGFLVNVEKFELKKYQFGFECSDAKLEVYRKVVNTEATDKLMCCPNIYYTQVYKHINNIRITDNDLVFYNNHELAKFLYPLIYEKH